MLERVILLIVIGLISFPLPARADGMDDDVLKKILGSGAAVKPLPKNEALRLADNKDKIIRLDRDAASVIVNNPAHAVVMLDSPRLLIVMPRQPGVTSFSALDASGNVILHKDVIVTNVQPKYVRVRRMCSGNDATCVPAAYYYCPDGCYEVTPVGGEANGGAVPAPVANAAANLANGEEGAVPPAQLNLLESTTVPATLPGVTP